MVWKAASVAVWMSLMAAASGASAAVIPVVNGSFETLPAGGLPNGGCGAGCSYSINDPVPGWSGTASFGQFRPGPASGNLAFFNSVPDGLTVAYSNGGSLAQTVAAAAVTGVTYTLSVDIGYRNDIPDNGTVELVVGSNHIANPILSPPQLSGNWVTDTIVYTAIGADAGAPISLVLSSPGAQGDWDNVRLSDNATAIPEPMGLALLGTALAALSVLRRRARPRSNSQAVSQD
jgi:hypothetical protein